MQEIVAVGASVRALVEAARRAGIDVIAADLFADRDLKECCRTVYEIGGFAELPRTLSDLPNGLPLVYAGGLENHSELLAELARRFQLWCIHGPSLEAIRRTEIWHKLLGEHGFRVPRTIHAQGSQIERDSRKWLVKPRNSGGGMGVRFVGHADLDSSAKPPEGLFQEFIAGPVGSAAYVADGSGCSLLGCSDMQVGPVVGSADPFRYLGSTAPSQLSPASFATLERIGKLLAKTYSLCGLFGVDFVCAEDQVFVLEINSRYTASMEVLELAGVCGNPLEYHLAAFSSISQTHLPANASRREELAAAKRILYAERDGIVGKRLLEMAGSLSEQWSRSTLCGSRLADLPHRSTQILAGQPICTVLARATSVIEAERQAAATAVEVQQNWSRA